MENETLLNMLLKILWKILDPHKTKIFFMVHGPTFYKKKKSFSYRLHLDNKNKQTNKKLKDQKYRIQV